MKTAQKILGIMSALALMLVLPTSVQAGQLKGASNSVYDPRPGTKTPHTFTFTLSTSSNYDEFKFQYCTTASGDCTKPAGLGTTSAESGTLTNVTEGEWTFINAADGVPRFVHGDVGESLTAGTVLTMGIRQITNHAIGDCGGSDSSDTCYVRIYACSNEGSCTAGHATLVDEAIVSYTVVEAVTVTARVNPTFTFVVTGVDAGQVNNDITTSVASTYSTLPFSNLAAGTPKYAAHQLNVTTNTQAGYDVTMRMMSPMTGVYSVNNIDPFAAGGVAWGSPLAWTHPTGTTPNVDTAWIGANTTDTEVSGWNNSPEEKFGPVNNSSNTVMTSSTSDPGSQAVYVTYAIEAGVRQPADTYTGTLVYNALPTY